MFLADDSCNGIWVPYNPVININNHISSATYQSLLSLDEATFNFLKVWADNIGS